MPGKFSKIVRAIIFLIFVVLPGIAIVLGLLVAWDLHRMKVTDFYRIEVRAEIGGEVYDLSYFNGCGRSLKSYGYGEKGAGLLKPGFTKNIPETIFFFHPANSPCTAPDLVWRMKWARLFGAPVALSSDNIAFFRLEPGGAKTLTLLSGAVAVGTGTSPRIIRATFDPMTRREGKGMWKREGHTIAPTHTGWITAQSSLIQRHFYRSTALVPDLDLGDPLWSSADGRHDVLDLPRAPGGVPDGPPELRPIRFFGMSDLLSVDVPILASFREVRFFPDGIETRSTQNKNQPCSIYHCRLDIANVPPPNIRFAPDESKKQPRRFRIFGTEIADREFSSFIIRDNTMDALLIPGRMSAWVPLPNDPK